MTKELICISCPIGCHLTVTVEEDIITVSGNRCPRGEEYGREEAVAPKRVMTAVVPTTSPHTPFLPVKSTGPVPRDDIPPLLGRLYALSVPIPVRCGDTILENVRGSGVDIVASRSILS